MPTRQLVTTAGLALLAGALVGCSSSGHSASHNASASAQLEQPAEAVQPVAFTENFSFSDFDHLDGGALINFDHYIIADSKAKSYFGGSAAGAADGRASFDQALHNELSANHPVVKRVGGNTLRVEVVFTDFRRSPDWIGNNPGFDASRPELDECFAEVRLYHSQTNEEVGRFLVEQQSRGLSLADFAFGSSSADEVSGEFASQIAGVLSRFNYQSRTASARR